MWPFTRREGESADVGRRVGDALEEMALGGRPDAKRTAAVQAGVRMVARAFAALEADPSDPRLTRRYLADLGAELIEHGASYRAVSATGLREVTDVHIGSAPDGEIFYRLRHLLPGREPGPEVTLPEHRVVHVCTPAGLSPLDTTAQALAHVERRVERSAKGPDLKLVADDSAKQRMGSGAMIKAAAAFAKLLDKPLRVAPVPPQFGLDRIDVQSEGDAETRRDLQLAVLGSMGVPPELLTLATGGAQVRESFRRFVRSTIEPMAELAAEELSAKLAVPDLRLDATHLHGADTSALSRAAKALVEAGMPLADALETVGLD